MSFIKFHSVLCNGLDKEELTIEALKTRGLSQMSLTGLPDAWLRDSRDKLRALVSQRVTWGPLDRVLVHLLPPERAKAGAHLELPIALSLLSVLADREPSTTMREKILRHRFVGSIDLEGHVLSTEGLDDLAPDSENLIGPWHFATLDACWNYLRDDEATLPAPRRREELHLAAPVTSINVNGREWERFWLLAAGLLRLPALIVGPPGTGKSTLAAWAQRAIPWGTHDDQRAAQRLHRLAGLPAPEEPPCITPHPRAHLSEFLGQVRNGRAHPGYFSLAHGGTLVLDEFLELGRDSREILRNVLDERALQRLHHGKWSLWPADFWLIATANPCPCGKTTPNDESKCSCPPPVARAYRQRLSGPLADRIALQLWVDDRETMYPFEGAITRDFASFANEYRARYGELCRVARAELARLMPTVRDRRGRRRASLEASLRALEQTLDLGRGFDAAALLELKERGTARAC